MESKLKKTQAKEVEAEAKVQSLTGQLMKEEERLASLRDKRRIEDHLQFLLLDATSYSAWSGRMPTIAYQTFLSSYNTSNEFSI